MNMLMGKQEVRSNIKMTEHSEDDLLSSYLVSIVLFCKNNIDCNEFLCNHTKKYSITFIFFQVIVDRKVVFCSYYMMILTLMAFHFQCKYLLSNITNTFANNVLCLYSIVYTVL